MMSKIYVYLRVVIALLALALCIDTLDLMRMGKFHIGISFSFSLALGILFLCIFWQKWTVWLNRSKYYRYLWHATWLGFCLWLLSLALFFSTLTNIQHTTPQLKTPQAIIVLGSGIEGNQPSPTLAKRLDVAGKAYQRFPHTYLVVTGGLGFNRSLTEAEVMAKYLQQHYQIPARYILQEDQSTSTHLNLVNSKALLASNNISITAPIAIVTSDFHTLRAKAIATHLGYQQPFTFAAETPIQIRYYSWVREYFAFVSGWLLGEY